MTNEEFEELSNIILNGVRAIDDQLFPKGGWNGWSTSGMRMMTDELLRDILDEYERIREKT